MKQLYFKLCSLKSEGIDSFCRDTDDIISDIFFLVFLMFPKNYYHL
jgi:hypothetical protein